MSRLHRGRKPPARESVGARPRCGIPARERRRAAGTARSPAYQCQAIAAHVDEFIDGELCDRETEGVESHLLACGECRRVFQEELDLKLLVRRSCTHDVVPDSVRDRVSVMVSRWRLDMARGLSAHSRRSRLSGSARRRIGGRPRVGGGRPGHGVSC